MKEYRDLLAGDPAWSQRAAALAGKVRDFSEFLAELGPAAPRHPLELTVAYHDACHLAHAQRITAAAARAAGRGAGAAAGSPSPTAAPAAARQASTTWSSRSRPASSASARRRRSPATGADLLVTGNPGCAMQIAAALAARGTRMPMAHIAEVLDASVRGLGASALLG